METRDMYREKGSSDERSWEGDLAKCVFLNASLGKELNHYTTTKGFYKTFPCVSVCVCVGGVDFFSEGRYHKAEFVVSPLYILTARAISVRNNQRRVKDFVMGRDTVLLATPKIMLREF